MKKILKFLKVDPFKQAILIQAFAVQLGVRIALGTMPFYLLLNYLQQIQTAVRQSPHPNCLETDRQLSENASAPESLAWAVRVTSAFVPGSRCLCQAIAAQMLLAYKGFSSELRIGVQKTDSSMLSAHAWLVRQGLILVGNLPNIDEFSPFPTLPKVFK